MNRILDERDKQTIEGNINSTTAVINQHIQSLEADVEQKYQTLDSQKANKATLNSHTNNISNPHEVTYTQVGADPQGSAATALNNAKDYTDTKIAALVDSSPETLNTLNELAAALNDDANFAATMTTELSKKTNTTDFTAHTSNKSNPHAVTASQVGLGNVPNVSTNNQTPTYTEASTLATLVSGEKLSVSFGKIMKAITDLISHIGNKTNPHAVTKSQVGLGNVDNTSDANKPVSTAQNTAISSAKTEVQNNLNAHTANVNNPHSVTAHQVGAYTQEETDAKIANLVDSAPEALNTLNELAAALGDDSNFATTMSTELGKKATKDELKAHEEKVNNPHSVTKSQVGLGNVDNTADTEKPVSTAQATAIADAKKAGTDAQDAIDSHVESKENPHNVTAVQVGADTLGSAAQALADAKNYTNSQLEFELETMRTLFSDRIAMLETRVDALPKIGEEDEGKVLCVVNGAYSLVSISDLLPGETDTPETPVEPEVPENPEDPTPEEPEV